MKFEHISPVTGELGSVHFPLQGTDTDGLQSRKVTSFVDVNRERSYSYVGFVLLSIGADRYHVFSREIATRPVLDRSISVSGFSSNRPTLGSAQKQA